MDCKNCQQTMRETDTHYVCSQCGVEIPKRPSFSGIPDKIMDSLPDLLAVIQAKSVGVANLETLPLLDLSLHPKLAGAKRVLLIDPAFLSGRRTPFEYYTRRVNEHGEGYHLVASFWDENDVFQVIDVSTAEAFANIESDVTGDGEIYTLWAMPAESEDF